MSENRNQDRISLNVPEGTKQAIDAISKRKGYKYLSEYIRTLIEQDTGLDLTTDMGNPNLKERGVLTTKNN